MTFRKIAALALAAGSIGAVAHAQTSTWTIDPNHSSSTFVVRHMLVSNVHGFITGVKGTIVYDEKDITKSTVTATLDLSTINTAVDARDKDLKSPAYFGLDKPENNVMAFKSTSITKSGGKTWMKGDLTTVTKPVTLELTGPIGSNKNGKGVPITGFTATGVVKRLDYGIGPKAPLSTIGDEIAITIDIEADKQS